MSQSPRGRHRAPSRLSSSMAATARVSAAAAVSGGLIAAVVVPANGVSGATAVGSLTVAETPVLSLKPIAHAYALEAPTGGVAPTAAMTSGIAALPRFVEASDHTVVAAPEERPVSDAPGAAANDTERRASDSETATAPTSEGGATASSSRVLDVAKKYIGVPYAYGGTSRSGLDCSGFTSLVFREVGVNLPRTSRAQQAYATKVTDPRPGDLVFRNFPATHVGIYVGNGQMIDSNRPGTTVSIHKMWGSGFNYGRVL